jgi:hypothetical protein
MPDTYLTGWIVDQRQRVRFVPFDATVIACDPQVLVFNQNGHFFVPNLEAGKPYEFIARNGTSRRRLRFVPRSGHNDLEIVLRTKPVRLATTSTRKQLMAQQARG